MRRARTGLSRRPLASLRQPPPPATGATYGAPARPPARPPPLACPPPCQPPDGLSAPRWPPAGPRACAPSLDPFRSTPGRSCVSAAQGDRAIVRTAAQGDRACQSRCQMGRDCRPKTLRVASVFPGPVGGAQAKKAAEARYAWRRCGLGRSRQSRESTRTGRAVRAAGSQGPTWGRRKRINRTGPLKEPEIREAEQYHQIHYKSGQTSTRSQAARHEMHDSYRAFIIARIGLCFGTKASRSIRINTLLKNQ